jgi:uncharacterized membrane protein
MANRDQARVRYEERRRRVLYRWVIRILTIGFVSSMVLILAGLAIAWLRGEPLGEEVAPLPDVLPGVFDLSPQGIVDLGILVLLFTPAAYTAVSLYIFLKQRDYVFVVVCSVLLLIAALSVGIGLQ